mgnify:CR=1 FL=1
MSKLIKAEFYRVSHSGIFLKIFIVMGLFPLLMVFISLSNFDERNMFSVLYMYSQDGGFLISGYVGILLSAMISNMYQNRTYYYEIMDGANTHHIILSKIIVYDIISAAVLIIPTIIVFIVMGNSYPMGGLEEIGTTVFLGILIIMNIVNCTIFITMLIRHILGGPVLNYTLGIFPTMAYMTLPELVDDHEKIIDVLSFLPHTQFTEFVKPEYETDFIVKVIGGFVVCFAVLYALTYASYKKKNFK